MKRRGIQLMFILLLGFSKQKIKAQQSMMGDISIPYLELLKTTAKENYPRNKIYTKRIEISEKNLNKIKLSWFDGLGIYYLYIPTSSAGVINPTNNRNGFQLGFSLNVGSLLEKPAQIKAAKGDRDVARLEKEEYELNIATTVEQRYYRYIQQLTILKQKTLLAQDAQTMLTSIRSKFERGEETFENFSKTLIIVNEQNQAKINSEAELLIAKSNLEELLKMKLEDVKLEDIK